MKDEIWNTRDSGDRREFKSGALRDRSTGKGRYDLISPLGIRRIAGVYERGAAKYDDRNWEKGMPISCFIDSALRHIFQYLEGRRDEDHPAQAAWNMLAVMHVEDCIRRGCLPEDLDDMPCYNPEGPEANV